jgi:hypothetical protein
VLGEVKNNFQAASVDMVCSAAFDRDDEFFATVGVSKRIKVRVQLEAIERYRKKTRQNERNREMKEIKRK